MEKYSSSLRLSIRRKRYLPGVVGDDVTEHNLGIGSSLTSTGKANSGLDKEEEKKYLPELIGISSDSNDWNLRVKEFWSNISAKVPADGTTTEDLQGRILNFVITFDNATDKKLFDNAENFEEKGLHSKKGEVIDGVGDFVLFRYCLVYNKVANALAYVNKSPRINFYLYSKKAEDAAAHNKMKDKLKAGSKLAEIITNETIVDGILRMFEQLPETFDTVESKHIYLFGKVDSDPAKLIKYAEDKDIVIKAALLKGVNKGILHQPEGTSLFYFGANNEVTLGRTIDDAVLWWKNSIKDTKVEEYKEIIKAQLSQ